MKFCTKCGIEIQDDTKFCPNCGTSTSKPCAPAVKTDAPDTKKVCPDTHIALALLSTLMFCLPLGIVSIVKSCNVTTEFNRGNYEAAVKASDDAKKWGIISIIAGAIVMLSCVIFYILYFSFLFLICFIDCL